MIVQQHHNELYSFKSLILPPLYLFDQSSARPVISKELIDKEPLICGGPEVESSVCSVASSASSVSSSLSSSSSSSCSASPESSPVTTRKVLFHKDDAGQMIVQEYAGLEELTLEDRQAAWYRSSESKYFRKYGKKLATIAAASKYGKDLQKTVKACGKGEKDLDKYCKIANSTARGLEVLVLPQLIKERRETIQSVLKAQAKARNDENMSAEERAEILRATSCILSRQTKAFAKVLGTGDSNVAKTVHEEDSSVEE